MLTNNSIEQFRSRFGELFDSIANNSTQWKSFSGAKQTINSFTTMVGTKYWDNSVKLMLVGRAVNGWEEKRLYPNGINREDFIHSSILNLCNDPAVIANQMKGRFEWIGDTKTNSPKHEYRKGIDPDNFVSTYALSRSKFWTSTKDVWCKLSNNDPKLAWNYRWYDNIVWSNLYKFAPVDEGNPDTNLMATQFITCAKLLLDEIKVFDPTHILIATGYEGWFDRFKDFCFSESISSNLTGKYVELSFPLAGRKVIVTRRPDSRRAGDKVSEYVEEVVRIFDKM